MEINVRLKNILWINEDGKNCGGGKCDEKGIIRHVERVRLNIGIEYTNIDRTEFCQAASGENVEWNYWNRKIGRKGRKEEKINLSYTHVPKTDGKGHTGKDEFKFIGPLFSFPVHLFPHLD